MTAALILAGGAGTRLSGVDKAFLPLAGKPLIAHVLARLYPQMTQITRNATPAIAISANGDPARFAPYALPILPDGAFTGLGPLAGVHAGLIWAKTIGADSLLTLPVDTPFFPQDLIARLTPAPSAALWRARQHHLCALWPVSALPLLETYLTGPAPHKVRTALSHLPARQVPFDSEADPFHNINTPEDLAEAQRILLASATKNPSWRARAKQPRL